MWLFTPKGFLSIVKHRDEEDCFIIRARTREHLEDNLEKFPSVQIKETPSADYRFRAVVGSEVMQLLFFQFIKCLTYDNFKNTITDRDYHEAAFKVWRIMFDLQSKKRGSNGRTNSGSEGTSA